MKGKKIGLALSGGGIRGLSHIGVLKVLDKYGVVPDMIAGTSAGSIFASLFAAGIPVRQMEKAALNIKQKDLLDWNINFFSSLLMIWQISMTIPSLFAFPPLGLIQGDKIEKILKQLLGNKTFNHIKKPIAVLATDINSRKLAIFTNRPENTFSIIKEKLVFNQAPLYEAVRASISLPVIFSPKNFHGYQLVDGGLRENVPVRVLKAMGADKIIAVDLGYSAAPGKPVKSVFEILLRSIDIMMRENTQNKIDLYADLVIRPELKDAGLLDLDKIPEFIRRGAEATEENIPHIIKLIKAS